MSEIAYRITGRYEMREDPTSQSGRKSFVSVVDRASGPDREKIYAQIKATLPVRIREDLEEIPARVHAPFSGSGLVEQARSGSVDVRTGSRLLYDEFAGNHRDQQVETITKEGVRLSKDEALYLLRRYPTLFELAAPSPKKSTKRGK